MGFDFGIGICLLFQLYILPTFQHLNYLNPMDLGNIVYIVAVLAYFIYQATRKKKGLDLPESDGSAPEQPQKGMTFEELMREIRQAQNPSTAEKPAPVKPEIVKSAPPRSQPYRPQPTPSYIPQAKPVSRKPVLVEEEDDEIKHYEGAFEGTKSNPYQAFKDTHSIPSTPLVKFDYDSINPKKVNPYAELLKNPKTLKQAVVVSEILKPKYF